MRHETRKLIHRVQRDGVEIVEGTEADMHAFYAVLKFTAEAKDFPGRDQIFFEQAWKIPRPAYCFRLLLAKYRVGDCRRENSRDLW